MFSALILHLMQKKIQLNIIVTLMTLYFSVMSTYNCVNKQYTKGKSLIVQICFPKVRLFQISSRGKQND